MDHRDLEQKSINNKKVSKIIRHLWDRKSVNKKKNFIKVALSTKYSLKAKRTSTATAFANMLNVHKYF